MNKNFSKSFWQTIQSKYELNELQVHTLQLSAFGILLDGGLEALRTQVRDAGPFLLVGDQVITK